MEEPEKLLRRRMIYPFSAIVGQEKAKLALLCVAVNPSIGGVLLAGDKGTGKSTAVRALADLLPEIEVAEGCPFNCNPRNPLEMCDECYRKWLKNELRTVKRKMRVIDLPLSITVDRLVGTLDIKRALTEGIRALQPGLLAEANRNILYIDEVNLLDDYVADVLLDAAALGWNIVEREGVSVRHPARFILVGSMNPEEGELRPQILDRFGLYVEIEAIMDPDTRAEIIRRVEEFHQDPISFYKRWEPEQEKLRKSIERAREIIRYVEIDDDMLKLVAKTIVDLKIRTHRAEIVVVRTAKAIAALDSRTKVSLEDIRKALELVLPHRLRSRPFEPPPKPPNVFNTDMKNSSEDRSNKPGPEPEKSPAKNSQQLVARAENPAPSDTSSTANTTEKNNSRVYEPQHIQRVSSSVYVDKSVSLINTRSSSKRYKATAVNTFSGTPIGYTLPRCLGDFLDVDIPATITAAVLKKLGSNGSCGMLRIEEEDIRVRVRRSRVPLLRVILLDSSGSMAIEKRISIAKGIAESLAKDSYTKRDFVSLIAFRGFESKIVVSPGRNYLSVVESLKNLPTGGRTPLLHALLQLYYLSKAFKAKYKNGKVVGILISDGRANVPIRSSLREDLRWICNLIREAGIMLEIYDTRPKQIIDLAPSVIDMLVAELNAKLYKV